MDRRIRCWRTPPPFVKSLLSLCRCERAQSGGTAGGRGEIVAELLALLDALPASVALWDNDVRLRYGNRRALTRFGRPPDAAARRCTCPTSCRRTRWS